MLNQQIYLRTYPLINGFPFYFCALMFNQQNYLRTIPPINGFPFYFCITIIVNANITFSTPNV